MTFHLLLSVGIASVFSSHLLRAEAPLPDGGHTAPSPGSKVVAPKSSHVDTSLFALDNLFAWCIVPFDGKKRGPEARAAMLERLGIRGLAYDYRAEHVPTFDEELAALKRHHIQLIAWWFPTTLNAEARHILDVLKRHKLQTQLWVTGSGGPTTSDAERKQRIDAEAARIRPIAEAAAEIGCTVALYNHGGWFGEPENQVAILRRLGLPNVGIVYNLHHGHAHIDRFPQLLQAMKPHLLAICLNGMARLGGANRSKILPIGAGKYDRQLLSAIVESGWRGPIGILNHTDHDAQARLQDNLEGLAWVVKQLEGRPPGPRPIYRTYAPDATDEESAAAAALRGGMLVEGRTVYRTPPITVDCHVTLARSDRYNILVACDTKRSGSHWELFSMPGSGALTAYLPGMRPDHVRSTTNIADGKPHHVTMVYQRDRVRLYVDGRLVADTQVTITSRPAVPADLGLGRLVEGGLTYSGRIESIRLRKGAHVPASRTDIGSASGDQATPRRGSESKGQGSPADDATIGLWRFGAVVDRQVRDLSSLGNPARVIESSSKKSASAPMPPPGPHLTSPDPKLRVVLIDRSRDDVYMAVKADGIGRLFVGGRTSVFVFEPDRQGGYAPRQTLFRFPDDSIIIGLALRGNDLYVQTGTALYVLPEGRIRRTGLRPQRLLWGLPHDLHVSFHCLAWGPAGHLYLNHGDPLLQFGDWSRPDHWGHWTLHTPPRGNAASQEGQPPDGAAKANADSRVDRWPGTQQSYTGTGAVLRMRADGSDLRVIARGLRGPVGLVFDPAWNLFTNDNDHESLPDRYTPARLLHVTPHIDFGWPRGWMASNSASQNHASSLPRPDNDVARWSSETGSRNRERTELIETMTDQLGPGVPCDMAFYDEPFLPNELRSRLLLCRWGRSTVTSYELKRRGSTFAAAESVVLEGAHNARPTGICVGRGGGLFVT
ncbi:MAG: LamG-like jellyroll fold domain-containing protein, partial [Pirellulales bacterium]